MGALLAWQFLGSPALVHSICGRAIHSFKAGSLGVKGLEIVFELLPDWPVLNVFCTVPASEHKFTLTDFSPLCQVGKWGGHILIDLHFRKFS